MPIYLHFEKKNMYNMSEVYCLHFWENWLGTENFYYKIILQKPYIPMYFDFSYYLFLIDHTFKKLYVYRTKMTEGRAYTVSLVWLAAFTKYGQFCD